MVAASFCFSIDAARSATAVPALETPPDLVTEPAVNLGSSSFYDGFGRTTPGFVVFDAGRWQHLTSVSDSKGRENRAFHDPDIEGLADAVQLAYVSPIPMPGGVVGWNVVLPLVELSSSFTQPGGNLRANGFAAGDLVWGPFYQARPGTLFGRTVSWRTEFDVISPSGGFDRRRDINQGSGFWSINPYVAVTALPAAGLEMTVRVNYIHNFATGNIPDPPSNMAVPMKTGQAGDGVWVNYASSYALTKTFSPGISGYYFQQLGDDKINGRKLAHTIKNQVYIGPGAHWAITKTNILNVNLYIPISTHGVASGVQPNFQYIHPF